jgi:uncharacterized RDD family membrane protein YckC
MLLYNSAHSILPFAFGVFPLTKEKQIASLKKQPASILLRLIALIYDALVLFAVLMLAVAVAFMINGLLHQIFGDAVLPANEQLHQSSLFTLYLTLIWFGFYGYFVTKSGQTIGLKAWRIHIESLDGAPLSWKQAGFRFLLGLSGVTIITGLFSPQKVALHDLASGTRLYRYPKP